MFVTTKRGCEKSGMNTPNCTRMYKSLSLQNPVSTNKQKKNKKNKKKHKKCLQKF